MRDEPYRSDRRGQGVAATRAVAVAATAFLLGIAVHAVVAGGGPADEASSRPTTAPDVPAPIGSSRLVANVPAGFARTEAGAIAAASAFVTTGQTLIDLDPLAAEAAVRQMATSSSADEQVRTALDDLRRMRDVLSDGAGPITFHQSAIAARVDRFDPTRTTVAVWSVGVLSRADVAPPQAGWRVSTFDLVWERDDWHVAAETVRPGPAPVVDDSTVPATSAQLSSALDGFEPLVGAPSAWRSDG
jgi:hypothetical protein